MNPASSEMLKNGQQRATTWNMLEKFYPDFFSFLLYCLKPRDIFGTFLNGKSVAKLHSN